MALRHNMEAGAEGAGSLERRLIVVGGAARSDLWRRIIADATGFPVWTIREEVEAALGAARLAALNVRMVGQGEVGRLVTLVERARPDPACRRRYDAVFAVYTDLYPVLKSAMHALAGLQGLIR